VVEAEGLTDPGRAREDNEDTFGLFPASRLYVVADGVGGRTGGRAAAELAVAELERFFRTQLRDPRAPWPHPIDKSRSLGANLLHVGLKVANHHIREAADADRTLRRMAATVAALAIGETQAIVAHVGDVRIYRIRDGALAPLTRDHSVIAEIRAARPELTEAELAAFTHQNVVTKALGTRDEVEPTVEAVELRRGDLFLLCSDGLWSCLPEALLGDLLNGTPDLRTACQVLVDAANDAGSPDNVTAVLVRVT
jgi:serine/threonine protein phosphatase PrpC